jgi:hypothetical protein
MPLPIFTIGHSTRTLEAFVALLRAGGADLVVDIRSVPRSRTNPQFNPDVLAPALACQIGHCAPKRSGGAAAGASLPTICSRRAARSST